VRSRFLYQGKLHELPFELNLSLLSPAERLSCLSSFVYRRRRSRAGEAKNFRDFALGNYGEIAERFLLPYAEKTWLTPPEQIDQLGAVGKGSQTPGLGDMIKGALGKPAPGGGFDYLYPKCGMQEVTRRLAQIAGERLRLDSEVISLDPETSILTLKTGDRWRYRHLVSTIPLSCLVKIMDPAPSGVREAAARLNFNGMAILGIELDGAVGFDEHYVLVPEPQYAFRRVSFPGNFSRSLVPAGRDSVVAEVSLARDHPCLANGRELREELVERVTGDLERSGLTGGRRIVQSNLHLFRPAHIIPDHHWAKSVEAIGGYLAEKGIQACGRFAEWRYLNIDDTILRAMSISRAILGLADRPVLCAAMLSGERGGGYG